VFFSLERPCRSRSTKGPILSPFGEERPRTLPRPKRLACKQKTRGKACLGRKRSAERVVTTREKPPSQKRRSWSDTAETQWTRSQPGPHRGTATKDRPLAGLVSACFPFGAQPGPRWLRPRVQPRWCRIVAGALLWVSEHSCEAQQVA